MKACDERDELRRRLTTAFEEWYAVKDVPGKNREAKAAEKKVHYISTFVMRPRYEARLRQGLDSQL